MIKKINSKIKILQYLLGPYFFVLFFISEAHGDRNLLIRVRLESTPNIISIRIEDQAGIKDISFKESDRCFPVVSSIPDIGDSANNFIVIIPWEDSDHSVYFSIKPTRKESEFDIRCQLKQLRLRMSSLRELEQMTGNLKEKIERYLWARDLFRRAEVLLNENHIFTFGALKQWFDASVKLAETEYDVFGLDNEAKGMMDRYKEAYGKTPGFLMVNTKTGYANGMANQAELFDWKGFAKVNELSKQSKFSEAYRINEHYINLWEVQDAETKKNIIHYWGVNGKLLENNKAFLNTKMN